MAHDRPGPSPDRLIVAELAGAAGRHARWGNMTGDDRDAGMAELREIAGDRPDLLAEVAGVAIGTAESKGPEYQAQAQAVAGLCIAVGADESLIPSWIEAGRRRAKGAWRPRTNTSGT